MSAPGLKIYAYRIDSESPTDAPEESVYQDEGAKCTDSSFSEPDNI